jgi:hypothetical protein
MSLGKAAMNLTGTIFGRLSWFYSPEEPSLDLSIDAKKSPLAVNSILNDIG